METERKRWKLGDDVSAEDNILDGFTFKDLILAVHCNCESITPEAVRREAAEILEEDAGLPLLAPKQHRGNHGRGQEGACAV